MHFVSLRWIVLGLSRDGSDIRRRPAAYYCGSAHAHNPSGCTGMEIIEKNFVPGDHWVKSSIDRQILLYKLVASFEYNDGVIL